MATEKGTGMNYPARLVASGKIVINEKCSCGAMRTEHEDGRAQFAQGHGPCKRTGCREFIWAKNVYKRGRK